MVRAVRGHSPAEFMFSEPGLHALINACIYYAWVNSLTPLFYWLAWVTQSHGGLWSGPLSPPGLRGKSTAISQEECMFLLHKEWLCSKTTQTICCESASPGGFATGSIQYLELSQTLCTFPLLSLSVLSALSDSWNLPDTYLLCPLRFTVYCQQSPLDFQSKQFFTFFLQCKPGSPWRFWLPCSILRLSPPRHTLYISLGLRWRLGSTWAEGR